MNDRDKLENQWRDWSRSEPVLDEDQLRRTLRSRLPDRRARPRTPLVLVAAAASLVLAILVGVETARQPVHPPAADASEMVYEASENVILVLREGADPIYVVTGPSKAGE